MADADSFGRAREIKVAFRAGYAQRRISERIRHDRLWGIIKTRTATDPSLLGKPTSPRHPNTVYALDFHVHAHLLHHTCITRWLEAGFDLKEVQYLAGHSTPDMTLRVYAHYDQRVRLENTASKIRASTNLSAADAAKVQQFSPSPVAP